MTHVRLHHVTTIFGFNSIGIMRSDNGPARTVVLAMILPNLPIILHLTRENLNLLIKTKWT